MVAGGGEGSVGGADGYLTVGSGAADAGGTGSSRGMVMQLQQNTAYAASTHRLSIKRATFSLTVLTSLHRASCRSGCNEAGRMNAT